MSGQYRVVEQIGDVTFVVPGHDYQTMEAALIAAVDLTVACNEEREIFVDGPGLSEPMRVGQPGVQR